MDVEEPVISVSIAAGSQATSGAVQMGSPTQPAAAARQPSSQGQSGPGCHPDFTEADRLNARALEPAFESMLRQAEVCEDVIMALRLQDIHTRQLLAALNSSEEGFRDTCKEAFHIDPSLGFKHKRELGRLLTVWNAARVQRDTKVQIEAVHKAHGEPISMIVADWTSLIRTFKAKYGNNIPPSRLPAQSYFEMFEERLTDGTMVAEPLSHVLSLAEEKEQKEKRPEQARHVGIHLDSTLTIQTRRRFVPTPPSNTEELRSKYKILTNLWLHAQMREPGRRLYADLYKDTFSDFADELISEKNFLTEKHINGVKMMIPQWEHCMNYEQELRNEAIRLTQEEGYPIKAALWAAYRNDHHRNENWVMLIGVSNAHLIRGGGGLDSKKAAQYEQRIQKLEQQLAQARSRSPRRNNQQLALPAPSNQQLVLPAPKKTAGKKGKGKGKTGGKNPPAGQPASSSTSGFRSFRDLMKVRKAKTHFLKQADVCFKFQSRICTASPCSRAHKCVGCGRESVPYDECGVRRVSVLIAFQTSEDCSRRHRPNAGTPRL